MGPLYRGGVVIEDVDGAVGKVFKDVEIAKDVGDMLERFCAVIDGTNFSFAGATGSEV